MCTHLFLSNFSKSLYIILRIHLKFLLIILCISFSSLTLFSLCTLLFFLVCFPFAVDIVQEEVLWYVLFFHVPFKTHLYIFLYLYIRYSLICTLRVYQIYYIKLVSVCSFSTFHIFTWVKRFILFLYTVEFLHLFAGTIFVHTAALGYCVFILVGIFFFMMLSAQSNLLF